MSSPGLRPASPDDGAAVQALVRRAFAHYVPRIGARPRPMDEDYAELARRGELWVTGDPVLGALVLQDGPEHLWVDVIAVEPDRQGGGVGRDLMRFAEDEAARRGHAEVRLLTHELMRENRAYYGRLGYEQHDVRGEPGDSLVYMRKQLGG